jgi:hypothetical protein
MSTTITEFYKKKRPIFKMSDSVDKQIFVSHIPWKCKCFTRIRIAMTTKKP